MRVRTRDLPDALRRALTEVGFHKVDIAITPKSDGTTRLDSPYGDGYQTFAVAVELETGRTSEVARSSWGGVNPFARGIEAAMDRSVEIVIPQGAILIQGQRGGGQAVSASIECHPDDLAPFLPPSHVALHVSRAALVALSGLSGLKPFARREEAERFPGMDYDAAIQELCTAGLAKQNRAGAVRITTEGESYLETARDRGDLPRCGRPSPWEFTLWKRGSPVTKLIIS